MRVLFTTEGLFKKKLVRIVRVLVPTSSRITLDVDECLLITCLDGVPSAILKLCRLITLPQDLAPLAVSYVKYDVEQALRPEQIEMLLTDIVRSKKRVDVTSEILEQGLSLRVRVLRQAREIKLRATWRGSCAVAFAKLVPAGSVPFWKLRLPELYVTGSMLNSLISHLNIAVATLA